MAHQEEDDLDLPPLDADEGDQPAVAEADDLVEQGEERGGLDDSTAADLDVGEQLDDLDGEGGVARGEAEGDVDVGALDEGIDFDEEESAAEKEDDRGVDAEGITVDEANEADDAGVEGTSEQPEDQVDESELPEIDDGEESGGDEALADALLSEAEGALPPWARARLAPIEGAGAAVPCRHVTVAAGRVAAAGEVLLFVEEGARAARQLPLDEGVVAVALAEDAFVAATARGQILASRDGGAEAVALGSWRSAAGTPAPLDVQLAATPGRFWIRAGGALSCAAIAERPAATPHTTLRERGVLAVAASGGALIAVTMGPSGPAIERFRGDDEGGMEAPLPGPARAIVERDPAAIRLAAAAGGRCLALGDGERVAVSRDGGATFAVVDVGRATAIAFAGDAADPPLLALVVPEAAPGGPSPAFVVQVSASGGAERIGEIPSAELPAAIAWDASREVVWVASGAGLSALGMPRRH